MAEPHKNSMTLCFECHGQNKCDHCHGRDVNSLFEHPEVKSLRKDVFQTMSCRSCHGHAGPYKRVKPENVPTQTPVEGAEGKAGGSGGAGH